MHAFETILARLGSRFSLNFRPPAKGGQLWTSPMGRFADAPLDAAVGIRVKNEVRCLPFTRRYPAFETVEQELTMTSVAFRCQSRALGIAATFRFVGPFYPQDEEVSTLPAFYLVVEVERLRRRSQVAEELSGELFFGLGEGKDQAEQTKGQQRAPRRQPA